MVEADEKDGATQEVGFMQAQIDRANQRVVNENAQYKESRCQVQEADHPPPGLTYATSRDGA